MRYPIAIEPRTDTSDYGVVIPDLPGCFSAGDTLEEAIAGAEEAGLAWIDATLDAGEAIPPPSSLEAIRAKAEFSSWILSVVTIDPGRARRYGRTRQYYAAAPHSAEARRGGAGCGGDAIGLHRQARDRSLSRTAG